MPETRHIQIASTRASVRLVEDFILELHDTIHFEESVLDKIMICVTEVVNNGIIHGNKLDPNRSVYLRCVYDEQRITFFIHDEGPGFEEADLPNPIEEKNLLKEGGRGMYIVRTLMDEVQFVRMNHGMEIRLMIHLHPSES